MIRSAASIAGALLAIGIAAQGAPAQAATGGTRVDTNPGIVALTDSQGTMKCTAVLVAPQWALTFESPSRCAGATMATGDSHDPVQIDDQQFPHPASGTWGNDPSKSQAMLVHLADPVQRVQPAKLGSQPPRAGERLQVVAFNGPEGINHQLSIGRGTVTAKGHSQWLSWYGKPSGIKLEGSDSGAPIMRGNEVVAFTGLVSQNASDAEDVANVKAWVQQTISQG